MVVYTPERWTQLGLEPGCGLVECKSSSGKVDVADLRDFGAKCVFHRVRFGILVARAGITGGKVNPDDLFKEPQNAEAQPSPLPIGRSDDTGLGHFATAWQEPRTPWSSRRVALTTANVL